MELIGLIWIISWIATIFIASSKGGFSQGCLAIFTGAIFGPIALIIALTYKPHKCPFCQEAVNKKAVVCPHCQKNITPLS